MIESHTQYMSRAFMTTDELLYEAVPALDISRFDTIVGTGMSGALVVPRLAEALGKHWMVVRKNNDGSHSNKSIEGNLGNNWLFVDDLIDSGKTFRRVVGIIEHESQRREHTTTLTGVYLYNWGEYHDAEGAFIRALIDDPVVRASKVRYDIREAERSAAEQLAEQSSRFAEQSRVAGGFTAISSPLRVLPPIFEAASPALITAEEVDAWIKSSEASATINVRS